MVATTNPSNNFIHLYDMDNAKNNEFQVKILVVMCPQRYEVITEKPNNFVTIATNQTALNPMHCN